MVPRNWEVTSVQGDTGNKQKSDSRLLIPNIPVSNLSYFSTVNNATTLPQEAIAAYVASLRQLSENFDSVREDSHTKEEMEEKEEKVEKEPENIVVEDKEEEKERLEELMEKTIEILEKNLEEEEIIRERINNEIEIIHEFGLLNLLKIYKNQ